MGSLPSKTTEPIHWTKHRIMLETEVRQLEGFLEDANERYERLRSAAQAVVDRIDPMDMACYRYDLTVALLRELHATLNNKETP